MQKLEIRVLRTHWKLRYSKSVRASEINYAHCAFLLTKTYLSRTHAKRCRRITFSFYTVLQTISHSRIFIVIAWLKRQLLCNIKGHKRTRANVNLELDVFNKMFRKVQSKRLFYSLKRSIIISQRLAISISVKQFI